ncbi:MAG: CaiB/BaiF CoA-transferase family protein [Syntrophaceae bacterium]
MSQSSSALPLRGVKIVEFGQLIAGPFAGKTLADFGAEVIKIEPPGEGDPLRKWRNLYRGTSVWWQVQSRNKQSIAVDLRQPKGQEIARRLTHEADVVIENFRPGTMEKWGLGWEDLSQLNPRLIMLRISGYGQTGPYRDLPGFGVVGEAMGGLRYVTGEAGRPPVRVGVSIGDSLAALHGVIGVLLALYHRKVNGGRGQYIDIALYETVFNIMESLLPEYDAFGVIRERTGSAMSGIAPTNAYPCLRGEYVIIAGNGDSIFRRLMEAVGRFDLADDPELAHNNGRVARVVEIDAAISAWTVTRDIEDVLAAMTKARVPAGRIYSAKDIVQDPHYITRGMFEQIVTRDGLTLKVPAVIPKLSETPGTIRTTAPGLGEDTRAVLLRLGYTPEQIDALKEEQVIVE